MNEICQVHIEGNTDCNGRCWFCPNRLLSRNEYLDYDIFTKVVDESIDMNCFNFCPFRVNEPFLFPELFRWLDYIKTKKATVDLFTNGELLSDEMSNRLLEYADIVNVIVFSFHGNNQKKYKENMGLDFNKVRDNIIRFMELNNGIKSEIFMLVLRDSIDENLINEYNTLWEGFGFTNIAVKGYINWAGKIEIPIIQSKKRTPCVRFVNQIDISCDGTVSMCCIDAFNEVVFGNVKDSSLKTIMESDLRKKYLDLHNDGFSAQIPICSRCNLNER